MLTSKGYTHDDTNNYDIVVIGGGPAGSATASLLAQQGHKTLILEEKSGTEFKYGESLPPQANPVLQRLDLACMIKKGVHLPCPGNQSAFGSSQLHDTDFIFSPYGHGWHLDRNQFDQDLLTWAQTHDVQLQRAIKSLDIKKHPTGWTLQWQEKSTREKTCHAKFIVDASGRAAKLLKKEKITINKNDRLAARCVLFSQANSSIDQRTLVEAVTDGWWYSAPLPHNKHVLMFFSDTDLAGYKRMKSYPEFIKAIEQTRYIKQKLAHGLSSTQQTVHSHSAQSCQAQTVFGDDWLAAGDAAIAYDPLSSQGIWQALLGAEFAAKAVNDKFNGSNDTMLSYQQWIADQANEYKVLHQQFYRQERRWPEQLFWSRRQGNN